MSQADSSKEHRPTLMETLKEKLPNPTEILLDQIIDLFLQWYDRRRILLSSIVLLLIPIYMIVIGILYVHSCPKSFYLPIHLILCGSLALIAAILFISMSILWKKIIHWTSKFSETTNRCLGLIFSIVELIIVLICLASMIALTIILITISKSVTFIGDQNINFCHPTIYYSSAILLILFYVIWILILVILLYIFHAYQKRQ